MSDEPLVAHSLAEVHLYFMASPCASCGRGLLAVSKAELDDETQAPDTTRPWTVEAVCNACHAATGANFVFVGDGPSPSADGGLETEAAVINSTNEQSRVLDVGQWIVLFRMLTETRSVYGRAVETRARQVKMRQLGIEAGQCLEEALKFYDDPDNDLPPPEAFFTDASRERFSKAPEQFSRQRLLGLRAKLPSMTARRSTLSTGKKKPWWRWRR